MFEWLVITFIMVLDFKIKLKMIMIANYENVFKLRFGQFISSLMAVEREFVQFHILIPLLEAVILVNYFKRKELFHFELVVFIYFNFMNLVISLLIFEFIGNFKIFKSEFIRFRIHI